MVKLTLNKKSFAGENFINKLSLERYMPVNECSLKAKDDENWMEINNCSVSMSVTRRIQRTIVRGNEGDDILDEGAESVVYSIEGQMPVSEYRLILIMFRKGGILFKDPFEERIANAIISKIEFDGNTRNYLIEIIEDVDIKW